MLQHYGKIGKAVLKRILGLQQDGFVLQYPFEKIDIEKSGCQNCPYFLLSQNSSDPKTLAFCKEKCASCASKVLSDEVPGTKKYIYEKSKYGYSKPMYLNSIKVFLYLHLYGYDQHNFIQDIDLQEIAAYFAIDLKTVRRALRKLCEYDYIYSSNISKPYVNILLPEASSYVQTGGFGYYELTKHLLDAIKDVKNINAFRILLRTLLEFDEGYSKNLENDVLRKHIQDIHKYLPNYTKPHIILDCIAKLNDIFETNANKKIVEFQIKDTYKTKQLHKAAINNASEKLKTFITSFNQEVDQINKKLHTPQESDYIDFIPNTDSVESLPYMFFSQEDCHKIATIFVKFDSDFIRKVLVKIYKHTTLTNIKIANPEAYVRTCINNLKKSEQLSHQYVMSSNIA